MGAEFLEAARAALSSGDLATEAAAFEALCVGASLEEGILQRPRPHNPNQGTKQLADWFDAACKAAKAAEREARRCFGRRSAGARTAHAALRCTTCVAAKEHER